MTRKDREPDPRPEEEASPPAPASRAGRSRSLKTALIGSAALHVALLAFLALKLPSAKEAAPTPVVLYEETVDEPAPPTRAQVYRGAPAEAPEPDEESEELAEAQAVPVPPRPEETPEPEESDEEALADRLLEEGIAAPGYSVTNLSPDRIERLAGSGYAVIVVQCGDADYQIRGAPSEPSGVDLADARLHGRFARRGLELEGTFPRAFHEIQDQFGVSRGDLERARVRLLFSIAIDNLILGRQEEAARRAGYGIAEVSSTRGRLVWGDGMVEDYRIDAVLDHNGKTVHVADRSERPAPARGRRS